MTLAIICSVVSLVSVALGCLIGRFAVGGSGRRKVEQTTVLALHSIATQLSHDVHAHEGRVRTIAGELGTGSPDAADVTACVAQIVEASDAMRRKLREAEMRIDEQAREMHVQALAAKTDPLTLLRNRGALDAYLSERLAAKGERGEPTAMLLLDLDHFKRLNDAHGHVAGDEVLKASARAMVDAAPSDAFVARYGGEEFAVVFPSKTASQARLAAETIRASVGTVRVRFGGSELRPTASAGLAESHLTDDWADWIGRVDEALYDAKSRGRNQGVWRCAEASLPFRECEPSPKLASIPKDDAGFDPVTGLSTRATFLDDLRRRHAQLRRTPARACLAIVRIEEYDALLNRGFKVAEQALKSMSESLRTSMRDSDHVARFGRETFALFLPEATIEDGDAIERRLRESIEKPIRMKDGAEVRLAIRFAAATLDPAAECDEIVAACIEQVSARAVSTHSPSSD